MGYKCLRNDFNIKLSKFGFGNVDAEGSALISFIEGGSGSLPSVGDQLYDYEYYGCGGSSGSYPNIRCESIEQRPYNIESGTDKFKYICTFSSANNTNNIATDFDGDLSVLSWDSPVRWRYGTRVATTTTIDGSPFGSVDGQLTRVVPTGKFNFIKIVSDAQIDIFWGDLLDLIGKLNAESIIVIGDSAGVQFQQGQVLCSGYGMMDRLPSGLYQFSVKFKWRIIGDKDVGGQDIESDDWNFVLAPNSEDDKPGGWAVPVQTSGSGSLAAQPFMYPYAGSTDFSTFLSYDYST